jgi:MFS family permease
MTTTRASSEISLFRVVPFRLLFITRLTSNTTNQMLAIVVGWQIYDLTSSPLALGLIGLVQFLPPLVFALPAGHIADRYDRRLIVRWCYAIEIAVVLGLLVLTALPHPPIMAFYGLLLINAMARTFETPALTSLLPLLVPSEIVGRAVASYSSAGKVSTLIGPSAGGLIYTFGAGTDYLCCLVLLLMAGTASLLLPKPLALTGARPKATWATVLGGLDFIWHNQIFLGILSLDLLVTFFGGVVALLPIFARDVLHIGPLGFGILRSSPALGALMMAVVLARYRITRGAGLMIFAGIAIYGVTTIVFALSPYAALSIAALLFLGAGDMISEVLRQTLIQVRTPNDTRGRVSSVSSLSVNIGGQLGMFESGVTAEWFGAVGSAIFGGVAVFLIIAIWMWRFPELRRIQRADEFLASP